MRSMLRSAGIVAGEWDWVGGPGRIFSGEGAPITTFIYCHGGAGSTISATTGTSELELAKDMAKDRVSMIGDFGGGYTFGNDLAISRVHSYVTYARANYGSSGPVALAGTSMGFMTALNYAREHPTEVACIAGIIPGTDIQRLIDMFPSTVQAQVDAAYPPGYNDGTVGQTHSPIHIAENNLVSDWLPIKLWSLPSDTIVPQDTHFDFVEARPQTEMVDITAPGAYHGAAAVELVRTEVVQWIKEKTHG